MTLNSRSRVLAMLVALALVVLSCTSNTVSPSPSASSAASATSNLRKTLVYGTSLQTNSFDPHRMNGTELVYATQMYSRLVQLDRNDQSRIVPDLAVTWAANADNTVFTFNLRKDAVFSGGNPVTANDVKFSLDRLWNIQSPLSGIMTGYKSIDVVDPYSVRITLTNADASWLVKMTGPQCNIIDSKVAIANGAVSDSTAVKADTAETFFNRGGTGGGPTSIGTGPFMMDSYVPNDRVTIVRNPKYWGPAPTLDKVVIQSVPDSATQRQLLERGSIDIAASIDFATAAQLEQDKAFTIKYAAGSTDTLVLFMTASPDISKPLSNKLVRQAVARAIDYNGILKLANSHAERPATTIPATLFGCCGVPPIQENLEQAKQLLVQAGYPNGFEVTFTYATGINARIDVSLLAAKLQSDLARVGIKLNLEPIGTSSAFLAKYRAATLAMGVSRIGGVSDPDAFVGDIWVSSHKFVTARLHFEDARIDTLYPQSLSTSGAARAQVYDQLQRLFQDDAAVMGLIQTNFILASTSKVSGYVFVSQEYYTDFAAISVSQ